MIGPAFSMLSVHHLVYTEHVISLDVALVLVCRANKLQMKLLLSVCTWFVVNAVGKVKVR